MFERVHIPFNFKQSFYLSKNRVKGDETKKMLQFLQQKNSSIFAARKCFNFYSKKMNIIRYLNGYHSRISKVVFDSWCVLHVYHNNKQIYDHL